MGSARQAATRYVAWHPPGLTWNRRTAQAAAGQSLAQLLSLVFFVLAFHQVPGKVHADCSPEPKNSTIEPIESKGRYAKPMKRPRKKNRHARGAIGPAFFNAVNGLEADGPCRTRHSSNSG